MKVGLKNIYEVTMASDLIKKLGAEDFKDSISNGLTLVDFFAEWCPPCRMLEPILEEIAEQMKGRVKLCKIDIDQAQSVTSSYQVTSVPTLILFKNGKEVNRTEGLKDADVLKGFISEHL